MDTKKDEKKNIDKFTGCHVKEYNRKKNIRTVHNIINQQKKSREKKLILTLHHHHHHQQRLKEK